MIFSIKELQEDDMYNCIKDGQSYTISYKEDYITVKFLYFTIVHNNFVFSTDFFELCEFRKAKGLFNTPFADSFNFFISKGYEPFDSTIIYEILKLPNLYELEINGIHYNYKLSNIKSSHKSEKQIVLDAIKKSFDPNNKNIILFSGGYDSTLLAKIAKDSGYNVELVNGAYKDNLSSNDKVENLYSNKLAACLDIPYRVVEIDPDKFTLKDICSIIESQPNTAHYSLIYYAIQKSLNKKDTNIVSGQQADSILNFGSTSVMKFNGLKLEGLGELIRRYIYMKGLYLHTIIFSLLNKFPPKYKQSSILIGLKKLPIIRNFDTFKSFRIIYDRFLNMNNDNTVLLSNNILFYIISHLQGSDASGILNIMKYSNNPLPFSNINLVKFYLNKKNSILDVLYPKKIIHKLLKEDKELYKILGNKPNIQNISYEIRFKQLANKLNLFESYSVGASKYNLPKDISFNKFHLIHCLDKIIGSNTCN